MVYSWPEFFKKRERERISSKVTLVQEGADAGITLSPVWQQDHSCGDDVTFSMPITQSAENPFPWTASFYKWGGNSRQQLSRLTSLHQSQVQDPGCSQCKASVLSFLPHSCSIHLLIRYLQNTCYEAGTARDTEIGEWTFTELLVTADRCWGYIGSSP